ncbi:hypothetical protein MPRF_42610 [Mycolicibacterium parafortuitum]|uniref:Uncharacterized protein n=1 Tax=Mycolicibacterium parafortuitum TaxID=39692 RepID=A0A375YLV2_MYCPF|nr:hypothetical protein MPRF_42610 [Mycolicibacterium parafortuitum]SRX82125.1 hypothetical protein [Actinoplanes friuliensis DSM 7358] [Mycolicibacterium parafortuitum]
MTAHDQHTDYDPTRRDLDAATAQHPADRQDYPTDQGAAPGYDQNSGYADRSAGLGARSPSEPPLTETVAPPSGERLAQPTDERMSRSANDPTTGPTGDHLSQQGRATDPSAVQGVSSSTATTDAAGGSSSATGEELFGDDERVGLRARWDSVQASFVDDPKECVQKADGLVSDVVDQLTSSFAHARSRLEGQWARGQEASTEDLRIALKRYREFFDRLLSV